MRRAAELDCRDDDPRDLPLGVHRDRPRAPAL